MKINMKNYEIQALGEFLYKLELKGKESRMRSRFISLLEERLDLINKEREILMKDFAKLNEAGEPVVEADEEGREFVILADKDSFYNERLKLMNEDFILDVTDKQDMLIVIQDIIFNVDKVFSGVEAEKYNRFCDILENTNSI